MRRTWAIARNLIKEVLRNRILLFFIILITCSYTFLFAWWLYYNHGLVDEKVQTFLSYSLSFSGSFLAFLTIFVSIATITRDMKRKEIFTIATKPIRRVEYLAGKFVGLALLNLVLLLCTGIIIYGLAHVIPKTPGASLDEKRRLNELVFNARLGVKPEYPDVRAEAAKWVEQKVKENIQQEPERYQGKPQEVNAMRKVLMANRLKELQARQTTVAPGHFIIWHFKGLKVKNRADGYVFLRYKQDVSANPVYLSLTNQWRFGPKDPLAYGGQEIVTRDVIRTMHELAIPAKAVSDTGDLYIAYRNPLTNSVQQPISVIFHQKTGVEVLYEAGSFTGNFIRTLLVIYLRLIFLSIFGLAMGAWLSFPVAVLMVLVIYIIGLASGFISDALKWESSTTISNIIHVLLNLFPKFSLYDPVPEIEKGRLVSTSLIVNCSLFLVLLKGGLLAGFGYLVFKFRELARIIV